MSLQTLKTLPFKYCTVKVHLSERKDTRVLIPPVFYFEVTENAVLIRLLNVRLNYSTCFQRLVISPTQGAGCAYCTVRSADYVISSCVFTCLSQTHTVCQTVRWVLKYIWQHEISSSITPSVQALSFRMNTLCLLALFTNTKWRDPLILTTSWPFTQHSLYSCQIPTTAWLWQAEQWDD